MIKAVIFDMDGTIIDSMPVWQYAGSRYVRSLGIEPEPQLDEKIFYMSITEFIEYIKDSYFVDIPPDKIFDDINAQIIKQYGNVGAKPGARELLSALKREGFTVLLATASSTEISKPVLSRLGMWEFFDFQFCNISKSKPDIFYEIAGRLNLKTDECCMAEDTLRSAESARLAGMKVIGVFDKITDCYYSGLKEVSDLYYLSLDNTKSIINDIKSL